MVNKQTFNGMIVPENLTAYIIMITSLIYLDMTNKNNTTKN